MSELAETGETGLEIAVIGMAGKFPGAESIAEFWELLKQGREAVSFYSGEELRESGVPAELLANPAYVKARGVLAGLENFDALFFGYTPIEAQIMDPQVRLFHQCAWSALEDAGYDPRGCEKLIGCYAGASHHFHWEALVALSGSSQVLGDYETEQLTAKDFLSTRVAYKLNLKGPAINVQTACSTSLAAVCLATQGLLSGECDMALAGGVTAKIPQESGYLYQEGMIHSSAGHCRAFDARADGTVAGNGMGCVVLKRLEDARAEGDSIYAVIKGTAINNDGLAKAAYTAPSAEGQAKAIRTALQAAEVEPERISYIETHGTGTHLGDPVELEGLKLAFNTRKTGFCALGAVKTNIGHLDIAAGIAGLIKTVLMLKYRLIPPTIHFETPNPRIDFARGPFYVNTRLQEWRSREGPLRAGVSSFGIGGTNTHVVLEEWPLNTPRVEPAGPPRLILLSAKTPDALDKMSQNLALYLKENPALNLADVAYTLQVGRYPFKYRKMSVSASLEEAAARLKGAEAEKTGTGFFKEEKRPVIFMFPGQGSQYVEMGIGLYRTFPLFRQEMDRCFEILHGIKGPGLKEILYPPDNSDSFDTSDKSGIHRTENTQPLLFIFEYALAKLLMAWGIEPEAMIGHSIGEYVAACLAGVFSLAEALKLVHLRGELMQGLPPGSMLSVPLPEETVIPLLNDDISLAAVNSSSLCVLSGPAGAMAALAESLKKKSVESRYLHTSHAFHSQMMDPILETFKREVSQLALKPPQRPYISNVTGRWIPPEEAVDPNYWATQLRQPIRFADGAGQLFNRENALFLEVGPGKTLGTFVRQHAAKQPHHMVLGLVRHPQEESADDFFLLNQVGQLWVSGGSVKWADPQAPGKHLRLHLPTYPFDSLPYRLEPGPLTWNIDGKHRDTISLPGRNNPMDRWFYIPSWRRTALPAGVTPAAASGDPLVLIFTDDRGFAEKLAAAIRGEKDAEPILVKRGTAFTPLGEKTYTVNPKNSGDYDLLLDALTPKSSTPPAVSLRVLHCWNVTGHNIEQPGLAAAEDTLYQGFFSLLFLVQALGRRDSRWPVEISVFSDSMQDVAGETVSDPLKSTLLGPLKVAPLEYHNLTCRSIDFVLPPPGSPREDELIRQLSAEWLSRDRDPVVAFRGPHRLVPTFEPVRLEEKPGVPPLIKAGGIYLLTGGLGGIGLALAQHLAQITPLTLVLAARSPFPPEDQWDRWLETHHETDPLRLKIEKLIRLKESGVKLAVLKVDVTDHAAMLEAVSRIRRRFGPLNGVIHCAGLPGAGVVQLKSQSMAEEVLAAKVKGTLVLDAIFKDTPLDFLVLSSSINAVVPMPGQVDYTAANAFLDAYAQHRANSGAGLTVSIDWERWLGTGMAASAPAPAYRQLEVAHPLLDHWLTDAAGRDMFATYFRLDRHWVLQEHRTRQKGVIAGTTYLEMVRAALNHLGYSGTLQFRELFFVSPLLVGEGETRESRLILTKQDKTYEFRVNSRWISGPERQEDRWQEHARGKVTITAETSPGSLDGDEIAAACPGEKEFFPEPRGEFREGFLRFGPRWQGLRRIKYSRRQGLARLELPEPYAGDVETYRLHPALLDAATGFFYGCLGVNAPYMPLSYKKINLYAPLPGKIDSYSRLVENPGKNAVEGTGQEFLTFNIVIMDLAGNVVLDIEEFTMMRFSGDILARIAKPGESPDRDAAAAGLPPEAAGSTRLGQGESGITVEEGLQVFNRVLESRLPQVVVSTVDLNLRLESPVELKPENTGKSITGPAATVQQRPELGTPYVEPQTGIQRALVEIWQHFLGIGLIGITDDFFQLGGDSLKAITLSGRIHKVLNVEVPLGQFFKRPTIAGLADYIHTAVKIDFKPVEAVEKREYYPISSAQKRLYILQQMEPGLTAYNLPEIFLPEGKIDRHQLHRVFRQLIQRHESLRTSFGMRNGEPVQILRPAADFALEELEATETQLDEVIAAFVRPFDLSVAPLLRAGLVKVRKTAQPAGQDYQVLMFDIHHIVYDGTSKAIFFKEFAELYRDRELPPLTVTYKDYSHWNNTRIAGTALRRQLDFWVKELAGEIPVLKLPLDYRRPPVQYYDTRTVGFRLSREESDALKHLVLKEDITLFMALIALMNVLWGKLSGQEDIVIGTPVAGRRHPDLEPIVGVFINTVALRNYPHPRKPLRSLLQEVKARTLNAFENQEYPFEDLIENLEIHRDVSRHPLFDTMFVLHNWSDTKPEPGTPGSPAETGLKSYEKRIKTSQFDIEVEVFDSGQGLAFLFNYLTKLFKEETIERFTRYFKRLVCLAVEDAEQEIFRLDLLSAEEKGELLEDFNDSAADYPGDKSLQRLFVVQATRTPDCIAVVGKGLHPLGGQKAAAGPRHISYEVLNRVSDRWAGILRARGVKPGEVVGILTGPTLEMVTGILAILKAGGAYLPLDPTYPLPRILTMLDDSGALLLLAEEKSLDHFSYHRLQENRNRESRAKPVVTAPRPQVRDLDSLPRVDRSLVDYTKYSDFIGNAMVKNAISINDSRGCPYNCAYCFKIWPKTYATRSPENLFGEVKFYYDMGVRRFNLINDAFNLDKRASGKFFKLLIANGLKVQLFFPSGLRGDQLSRDYIDLLVEAGTVNLALALETASPRLQKLIDKNLNLDTFYNTVDYISRQYPQVILELFTMHGLPTETEAEALMTLDFIKSIRWIHFPYVLRFSMVFPPKRSRGVCTWGLASCRKPCPLQKILPGNIKPGSWRSISWINAG
jgi:acyl transferase domain-containing protein/acyl carrier protein